MTTLNINCMQNKAFISIDNTKYICKSEKIEKTIYEILNKNTLDYVLLYKALSKICKIKKIRFLKKEYYFEEKKSPTKHDIAKLKRFFVCDGTYRKKELNGNYDASIRVISLLKQSYNFFDGFEKNKDYMIRTYNLSKDDIFLFDDVSFSFQQAIPKIIKIYTMKNGMFDKNYFVESKDVSSTNKEIMHSFGLSPLLLTFNSKFFKFVMQIKKIEKNINYKISKSLINHSKFSDICYLMFIFILLFLSSLICAACIIGPIVYWLHLVSHNKQWIDFSFSNEWKYYHLKLPFPPVYLFAPAFCSFPVYWGFFIYGTFNQNPLYGILLYLFIFLIYVYEALVLILNPEARRRFFYGCEG